jgi:predicted nuclease of restriction endonuclease-like (RecB) superfamily
MQNNTKLVKAENLLFKELSQLIEQSKNKVVSYANSTLTLLFWQVGKMINEHVLQNKRAEYGKQIVVTVSRQLTEKYGRNFEEKNLRRMMQFADQFAAEQNVVTVSRHLSWSHIITLLPIKQYEAKHFYAMQTAEQGWGVRELREQIETKTYERTKIANTQIAKSGYIPLNTFKDPYVLDFLGLKDTYLEDDLELAILRELEQFILEVGKGFAFVERQKRMIIDGEDHHLDLLFFHRKLRRLVAIDLKIGKFQAKDKGQMELYLKWLDRYEKHESEEKPLGLILCAETSREQVELLEMHKDGIMVAQYWTELPPKRELERKLHEALIEAKENLEKRKLKSKVRKVNSKL